MKRLLRLPAIRSMLFVPGTRPALAVKGIDAGADAIVFDLEDAVPPARKADARAQVGEYLRRGAAGVPLFVRINALSSDHAYSDLREVVGPNLAGIMIPKVETREDIVFIDRILGWLETESGAAARSCVVIPVFESALGMRMAFDIARSSSRVAYAGGIGVRGGDVEQALGYRWSPDGRETEMMRSSVLLDMRAADVPNPLSGVWMSIEDTAGLARFAEASRSLGYEGMLAIHPSHISVINAAFTATPEEVARDRRLIAAFRAAAIEGQGVIDFEGSMVDDAMFVAALRRLERARQDE